MSSDSIELRISDSEDDFANRRVIDSRENRVHEQNNEGSDVDPVEVFDEDKSEGENRAPSKIQKKQPNVEIYEDEESEGSPKPPKLADTGKINSTIEIFTGVGNQMSGSNEERRDIESEVYHDTEAEPIILNPRQMRQESRPASFQPIRQAAPSRSCLIL